MLRKLNEVIEERAEESSTRMYLFGIFGLIAYLPYYLINRHLLGADNFDSFWLRASIALLCLILFLKNYWPSKLIKFLPIYWYLILIYSMPFFLTYMTLMNHGATAWVMNLLAIIILMMLLTDWISYTILLFSGMLLAWIIFKLTTTSNFIYIPGIIGYKDIINTLVPSIIIGIIFSYDKEKVEKEKFNAMKLIAANLAHELRTPLAAIKASASATKDYLPDLITAYKIAQAHELDVPIIYPDQFLNLKNVLDEMEIEVEQSNSIIDMLLMNSKPLKINQDTFEICSISNNIEEALKRYPFSSNEKNLIFWDKNNDFLYKGKEILTIHVIFNLMKNSLYYIMNARKGSIEIKIILGEDNAKYNYLSFLDTGSGIDAKVLPHIFDRFFSETYHGYGIGLAFCKMVMKSYNGNIVCDSVKEKYTEFVLSFPKLQ